MAWWKKETPKPSVAAPSLPAPYKDGPANHVYNLLFCDDPEIWRNGTTSDGSALAVALREDSAPADVRRVADDEAVESRIRALAFNWLRRHGQAVPAKTLLGTIVEVPLQGGLDTLAAFGDGGVRYINQSGKIGVFDGGVAALQPTIDALLAASRVLVGKIGPWEKPRLNPPKAGNVRLTFLVSDGLYFGEGPYADLARDGLGGPVLAAARQLLEQVVALSTSRP
jgi:hypothetical protein